jgi:hypothetical protein
VLFEPVADQGDAHPVVMLLSLRIRSRLRSSKDPFDTLRER